MTAMVDKLAAYRLYLQTLARNTIPEFNFSDEIDPVVLEGKSVQAMKRVMGEPIAYGEVLYPGDAETEGARRNAAGELIEIPELFQVNMWLESQGNIEDWYELIKGPAGILSDRTKYLTVGSRNVRLSDKSDVQTYPVQVVPGQSLFANFLTYTITIT